MLLVMDVGNSHSVIGLYEGDALRAHWRITTANYHTGDELRVLISVLLQQEGVIAKNIRGCAVSSVVPQMDHAIQQALSEGFQITPLMVGPGIKTGLVLQCENPKEIGADRIVNAVGALEEHAGDLLLVDFGTATTFDVVTADARYRGGVILPGVQVCAEALFKRCAKLPRVDILKPSQVIGRNTVTNIQSGLTYGYAEMVDGLVRRISEEMGVRPKTIATGGIASLIAEIAREIDCVDPFLTLKGLKTVYRKNERELE